LIIALLTAFDHVDTRFTPLSCHVYSILDVLVVHCRHSGGKCLDLSACVSARSFRGTHTHTHTHTHTQIKSPLHPSPGRFCSSGLQFWGKQTEKKSRCVRASH
jgi:hypothetical protein